MKYFDFLVVIWIFSWVITDFAKAAAEYKTIFFKQCDVSSLKPMFDGFRGQLIFKKSLKEQNVWLFAPALIGKYEDNLTALDYFGLESSLPLHDWSYPKPDYVINVIAIFVKDLISFKRLDRN